jgi:FkbM family methyltransferase
LKEKYSKLVEGLDEESVLTVQKLLARLQQRAKGELMEIDENERKILTDVRVNLQNDVVEFGDVFVWNGYFLPRGQFEASVFYHRLHVDSLRTLDRIRGRDVIDAGAWIGDSALILSEYTDGRVFAFEPVSRSYKSILKTIEMNGLKSVVPVNFGLGDRNESRPIYLRDIGSSSIGSSLVRCDRRDKGSGVENVRITTVDDFVRENGLRVGLIKADIEGFEQNMLRGARKTIEEQKPALIICIYHNTSDFFDIKPLIDSWRLGYKFRIVKGIDGNAFAETMLLAEVY